MQWRCLGMSDPLHNSSTRVQAPVAAVPTSLSITRMKPDANTPPPTPTEPLDATPNGQQEDIETPPPPDEPTPSSDSTVSPKDSLEPSDDTATPSDEGTPFTPPP